MSCRGHFWTLYPRIREVLRLNSKARDATRWTLDLAHAPGCVLTGALRQVPGAEGIVVLIHGLGGSIESPYMHDGALAAERLGLSSLRLNLRGADLRGDGFYHAGLTADLSAVLSSPLVGKYRQVLLVGYSLGGHLVLRYLGEGAKPAVAGGVSICSPVKLSVAARHLDRKALWLYRRHVMRGLHATYAAYCSGREVAVSSERASRIRTIAEWDERIVAPHHGFRDAEDYWASTSAAAVLGESKTPTVSIWGDGDPMVPRAAVEPYLVQNDLRDDYWIPHGGHVGFSKRDLLSPEEMALNALLRRVRDLKG